MQPKLDVTLERQPDGHIAIKVNTSVNPDAGLLYDFFDESRYYPDALRLGVDMARHPENVAEDDIPFWGGDATMAQVLPDHVVIEHYWTEEKLVLSHHEFIELVERYLRLLTPRD
ncbi:hypothetical protein [Goodfellowiella coeruleoviolacea]|uniref:Uncharacterized protein n=1 Tax=Goodfellowiella coeruleoviolacea TaxID=334858 RepID=A0AAE3G9Y4_9PSEU|nr:hypothetical protein [Goodfellowiella coeruleoviolacea]MCP2164386.1 hypothetical protein [Goodfellowiella coeruleoviolacea]